MYGFKQKLRCNCKKCLIAQSPVWGAQRTLEGGEWTQRRASSRVASSVSSLASVGEGPSHWKAEIFFFPSALTPICCLVFIKQNLFHFSWCERIRVLSKVQRQRSSVTAGLLNPFSHLFLCQSLPKCSLRRCSSLLTASSLRGSGAVTRPFLRPPPPAAATKFLL